MKLKHIEVFSKDELKSIHSASMELISEVGIKVDAQDTRDLLKEHGAEVNEVSHFAKFPESMIIEYLKTVPDSFKLYGPYGSFHF